MRSIFKVTKTSQYHDVTYLNCHLKVCISTALLSLCSWRIVTTHTIVELSKSALAIPHTPIWLSQNGCSAQPNERIFYRVSDFCVLFRLLNYSLWMFTTFFEFNFFSFHTFEEHLDFLSSMLFTIGNISQGCERSKIFTSPSG